MNSKTERMVREFIWLNHGHGILPLYGDDGELQCSKCMIDFKRMPLDELLEKVERIRIKEVFESQDDSLPLWFGLSRASWLTLPRVLMQAMPKSWQRRMANLLFEYDEAFPYQPDIGTRVQITKNGKLIKTPEWLLNYRCPDQNMINSLRKQQGTAVG